MGEEFVKFYEIFIGGIKFVTNYIIPIAAFIVSLIALKKSNETVKVKVQLTEVEEKLKHCELMLKEHELEKINALKKPNIEARVINILHNKYRLKVWNSGEAKAYNIMVDIPSEYGVIIMNETMPFECLEPGNSFEEVVVVHMQTKSKFRIKSSWNDDEGHDYTNEQWRTL